MKKIFPLILVLIISISLFAQENKTAVNKTTPPDSLTIDSTAVITEAKELTAEEKFCKKRQKDISRRTNRCLL